MQKQVEKKKYYVVRERAVPEVLLKVVEAKRLLESKRVATVQEAAERTGISRSSFYKYKDDIFPFHEETKGKTITFIIQMDDEPGLLSMVLQTIARFHGNILYQCIPEMDRAGEKERITLLSRNPIKTEKRTPQAKKRLWSFFYYDNISLVQKQLSL